jgi:hypothetical protein
MLSVSTIADPADGVKSGDRGGHRINVSSSCPVRPIHICGKIGLRYPGRSLWVGFQKILEIFILYQHKNSHDLMNSLFVVNF